MKIVIKGANCYLTEKTAIAVLYPNYAWCKTLAEAKANAEADKRAEEDLWSIEDYDVFSDVYKDIYGVRPRWITREEFKRRKIT